MTDQDKQWVRGWDAVFEAHWERNQGPAQTAFFARVTMMAMPAPLRDLIRCRALALLDWGCALGDALPVFAEAFPESSLTGLDVSAVAVARARARYPRWHFTTTPLREQDQPVPVLYTSNCLEHFAGPLDMLRREILPFVSDYALVLVPFGETELAHGHLVSFDAESFPPQFDGFGMLFWRVLPTGSLPGSCWPGRQLLVIYARRHALGIDELIPALQQWQGQMNGGPRD